MRVFWALLGLVTPVILLYSHFLGNPSVFDDVAFFSGEEYSYYLHIFSLDLRWLSLATFVWTRELLGDAMLWLRLGNLSIHLLNTVTLFLLLRRLFDLVVPQNTDNKALSSYWLAFFAALIFALHPVSVYAVGYLIQRTTLLATLFALLTWRCFLEGLIREQRLWFYLSALCYLLAGLSKEHAIMTPAITVALLCLLNSQPLQRVRSLYPVFIAYGFIGLFIVVQIKSKHLLGQTYEPFATGLTADIDPRVVYPLSVLTQSFTFFKYLWVWLVPSPALMSVDSCQTFATKFWTFPESLGLVAFVVYPVIAVRLLLKRGLIGLFGFALLSPWLLFFTELSTVRIQEILVLYRSYLWMPLLFASLPFLCQKLTAKQAAITLSCIALLMMPLTWFRLTTFSHPLLLWDDAARRVKEDKDCPMVYRILNNRGKALMELERYDEAIHDFTRAIEEIKARHRPIVSANSFNRGVSYLKTQQYQLALEDFNSIPEPISTSWSSVYLHKGNALEALHDLTAAHQSYERACLAGIKEGCAKQKELEALAK